MTLANFTVSLIPVPIVIVAGLVPFVGMLLVLLIRNTEATKRGLAPPGYEDISAIAVIGIFGTQRVCSFTFCRLYGYAAGIARPANYCLP